jgi:hypothetical protein
MADIDEGPSTKPVPDIRIVCLTTNKTRRTLGSYTAYQVYFKLSANPPMVWRDMFGREWRDLNPAQGAGLDGRFLVIQSPLEDIATIHLPALKKAVEAANTAYRQFAREQVKEDERKGEAWRNDRHTVEALARTLTFE